MVVTVSMVFWTVSEQKSKVSLISEFSYLALGQIRKLGKIFLSFRNDLRFKYLIVICNCGNCLHAFPDCFRASK